MVTSRKRQPARETRSTRVFGLPDRPSACHQRPTERPTSGGSVSLRTGPARPMHNAAVSTARNLLQRGILWLIITCIVVGHYVLPHTATPGTRTRRRGRRGASAHGAGPTQETSRGHSA